MIGSLFDLVSICLTSDLECLPFSRNIRAQLSQTYLYFYTEISVNTVYFQAFDNLKSEHSEDDFARLKKIVELLSSEKIMSQKLNSEFETYAASVASALKQVC